LTSSTQSLPSGSVASDSGNRFRVRARAHPHLILAGAAAANLLVEIWRNALPVTHTYAFLTVECCVVVAALAAIRGSERIRLWPLVLIAVAFQSGWVAVQLGLYHLHFPTDSSVVYRLQGNRLLDGQYPHSEYPPGAVALFGLEALTGSTRVSNALLMVPFGALAVGSVWALRTRSSALLAAFVALWPANAYFWAYRFDLVPTALLAAGLLLVWRRSWAWGGVLLGLGAAVKWTPALAVLAVGTWLLTHEHARAALRHVGAAVLAFLLISLPFFVRAPRSAFEPYRKQAGRGITAESVYYLPLRALGLAHRPPKVYLPAGAPSWADHFAIALQIGLIAGLLAIAARARTRHAGGVAAAACAPAAFLLANKIFSPQFFVTILTGLAIAFALVGPYDRRGLLRVILVIGGAALADAFVFPFIFVVSGSSRPPAIAVSFALALTALAWAVVRAARQPDPRVR
jgi:hypothetical protein